MSAVLDKFKIYQEIADAIFGYFESKLMGDGANSFEEYKAIVTEANVGPFDKELWDLLEKMSHKSN